MTLTPGDPVQVKVPMAVFGMGSSENEPLGALDRFKKRSRPDE